MSKKISEFITLTTLEGVDWLTGLDADQPDENLQNIKITKTNALADYQPIVPTGGANYLGQSPNWVAAGNSATRDVGTGSGDVAAGNAPAVAVSAHESTFDHTRIQTANQKAAADAANAPSGVNAYATINDIPAVSGLHADLTDLATSGHPGTVITIPAGTPGNAVNIAGDGSIQDSGKPPGASNHADLPDLATSGHPGGAITIPGGVQGNAVAIDANENLVDSGIPPGGTGGAGVSKGTPFITDDLVAVQNAAGDGVINTVGFAPSDVARLSQAANFAITVTAQTGLFDGANRVYSLSNVPPLFTDSANGYVPASGGGTTNFLRADGTFAPPPGGGGGVSKGTPFVVGDLLAVQSDAGDGIIQSIGVALAALMLQGGTIIDWGETGQLLTPTGNQTFDLDNGHFFYNTTSMTGDKTINFQSTANHDNTPWTALIDIGTRTVNWEFNSVAIKNAEGYNISAGGLFLFTFVKAGSTVVVSERGITP